jgi:L-ascorbate metabolism protein UlaG (beta-lactamase superfamily)
LLPVDGSQHVLSYEQVGRIAARLQAKVIVPHHYYVWDITTRGSTLLPPDAWVKAQPAHRWVDGGTVRLPRDEVLRQSGLVLCFGENVAFDKAAARGVGVGA